jgi:hypothetical protein
LERGDHRVIRAVQQRVRRCGHLLALETALSALTTGIWLTTIRCA